MTGEQKRHLSNEKVRGQSYRKRTKAGQLEGTCIFAYNTSRVIGP